MNVERSTSKFKVIKGYKTLTGDEDIDLSTTIRGELWVTPGIRDTSDSASGPA